VTTAADKSIMIILFNQFFLVIVVYSFSKFFFYQIQPLNYNWFLKFLFNFCLICFLMSHFKFKIKYSLTLLLMLVLLFVDSLELCVHTWLVCGVISIFFKKLPNKNYFLIHFLIVIAFMVVNFNNDIVFLKFHQNIRSGLMLTETNSKLILIDNHFGKNISYNDIYTNKNSFIWANYQNINIFWNLNLLDQIYTNTINFNSNINYDIGNNKIIIFYRNFDFLLLLFCFTVLSIFLYQFEKKSLIRLDY